MKYYCNPTFKDYCPFSPDDIECNGQIYLSDGVNFPCFNSKKELDEYIKSTEEDDD